MQLNDPSSVSPLGSLNASATAEEKLLVGTQELLPEPLLVQDVGREYLRGNATCQVFNALATEAPFDGRKVSMSLGVALFQQGQPRLLLMGALGKIQGTAVRLIYSSV